MRGESFDWTRPSPMWRADGADVRQAEFFRPRILEFHTDEFMNEFLSIAARPGSAGWDSAAPARSPLSALKLFQPIQQRFYLVTASLCCRRPGFPDHGVRKGDRASFVVRKIQDGSEFGWVPDGADKGWQRVANAFERALAREQRHPLFATVAGNRRSVLGGYIPVASRDTFAAAPTQSIVNFADDIRLEGIPARLDEMRKRLTELPEMHVETSEAATLRVSVYLLLDLFDFLQTHLPALAEAIRSGRTTAGAAGLVRQFLLDHRLGGNLTLLAALAEVARLHDTLAELHETLLPGSLTKDYDFLARNTRAIDVSQLKNVLRTALEESNRPQPPVEVPKNAPASQDTYVIRCLYERPHCDPPQVWVGRPSEPFLLAGIYDTDAPVRHMRVAMPPDLSLSELRKMKKGAGFILSPELRHQMSCFPPMLPLVPGGCTPQAGMMCSLSIPIVTVCAYILLTIIVNILNVVFRWLPYFEECVPLKPPVPAPPGGP